MFRPWIMNERKLREQINKLRVDPLVTPVRTPVLLSDSKGFYLKGQVRANPERFIEFWGNRGDNSDDCLNFLRNHLASEVQRLQHISLFIWIGTCDLTRKTGKFIDVSSHDSSSAYKLIDKLKQIYTFVRDFKDSVQLTFLRIPIYSIYHWNLKHGRDWDNYKAKDVILNKNISIVNNYIADLNRVLNVTVSPRFSEDLQKSKKKKPGSTTKYFYTYDMYIDGIHPSPLLAKLWLTRLCKLVHDTCY